MHKLNINIGLMNLLSRFGIVQTEGSTDFIVNHCTYAIQTDDGGFEYIDIPFIALGEKAFKVRHSLR